MSVLADLASSVWIEAKDPQSLLGEFLRNAYVVSIYPQTPSVKIQGDVKSGAVKALAKLTGTNPTINGMGYLNGSYTDDYGTTWEITLT